MKNRKMRLIIGMLIGLVIFSSSVALLMYTKIGKEENKSVATVEVYVASKNISRGSMIVAEDLLKTSLPKSYLAFTPLTAEEIIGRYSSVDIFAKEPMRKEKLSITKPVEKTLEASKVEKVEESEQKQFVQEEPASDTLSVSLSLFSNIDSSLQEGDFIDIVSVTTTNGTKFKTKYVVLHVPIRSFVSHNAKVDSYIYKNDDTKSVADSIVFEMTPNEIKNFLNMHYITQGLNAKRVLANPANRGHLWMVKCSPTEDKKLEKVKERMMVDHKQTVIKRKRKQNRNPVSISYE